MLTVARNESLRRADGGEGPRMYGCPNPANILIVLTLMMFRRWEVAGTSALGFRRREERISLGYSGLMLACLARRARMRV